MESDIYFSRHLFQAAHSRERSDGTMIAGRVTGRELFIAAMY
jgi:hypothetical protein